MDMLRLNVNDVEWMGCRFPGITGLAEEFQRLLHRSNSSRGDTSDGELPSPRHSEPGPDDFASNGVSIDLDEMDELMLRRPCPTGNWTYLPDTQRRAGRANHILSRQEIMHLIQQERAYQCRGRKFKGRQTVCVFCRNNGECEAVYHSHLLKDSTGRITCPILRAYTCPMCHAKGDDAHTLKYCPLASTAGPPMSAISAIRTARLSTGRKR